MKERRLFIGHLIKCELGQKNMKSEGVPLSSMEEKWGEKYPMRGREPLVNERKRSITCKWEPHGKKGSPELGGEAW